MSWTYTLGLVGALQWLGSSSFASATQNNSQWEDARPGPRAIEALEVDWQLELPRERFSRALSLRLPEIQLDGPGPRALNSARVRISEVVGSGEISLLLRLGDGRSYQRNFTRPPEQPARAVASTLANLIVAIEVHQLPPDPIEPEPNQQSDAATGSLEDTAETVTVTETVTEAQVSTTDTKTDAGAEVDEAELEAATKPAFTPESARDRRRRTKKPKRRRRGRVHAQRAARARPTFPERPRAIESAVALRGGGVLVPIPRTASWGGRLDLNYRHDRPFRIGLRAAALQAVLPDERFRALRVAGWLWVGTGLQLRPKLELRASWAVGIENWWVSDRDDSSITPDHPPMLRSDVHVGPHWQIARSEGHELHLGLELQAGYGGQIELSSDDASTNGGWTPPLVRSSDGEGLATFGGFEVGVALELRWTAHSGAK